MTCASQDSSPKASSRDWLPGKVKALECTVSEFPRRLEMLEQRADLLEKIFLFVDIDVLNKAITSTTGHRCGPPVLLPACQVPSHVCGYVGGHMNKTCGSLPRTLLGSHRTATLLDPQKVPPKLGGARAADATPKAAGLVCSAASADSLINSWPGTMEPIPEPESAVSTPVSAKRVSLVAAAEAGEADVVAMLLEGKADPDSRNADSETALHRAAYWAKKDIVHLLLDARADASARDRKGKTPMRKSYDNPDIVAALLRAGADPNAVDESGRTTLHRSAENGHVDVIEVLIEGGADPNIGNMEEETPLHEAANFGQVSAIQALVDANSNVDATDAYGGTPLHFAAYGGHASIAKLLVAAGADVFKANKDGEIPLNSAEQGNKTEVVDILQARSRELAAKSKKESITSKKDCTTGCSDETVVGSRANSDGT